MPMRYGCSIMVVYVSWWWYIYECSIMVYGIRIMVVAYLRRGMVRPCKRPRCFRRDWAIAKETEELTSNFLSCTQAWNGPTFLNVRTKANSLTWRLHTCILLWGPHCLLVDPWNTPIRKSLLGVFLYHSSNEFLPKQSLQLSSFVGWP